MQSREQVNHKLNNCNFKTAMMPNIGYKPKVQSLSHNQHPSADQLLEQCYYNASQCERCAL